MNEQQSYIDNYECFLCGSDTKRVFNLGYNYPSTFTEKPEIPEGLSPKILALRECLKCKCVRIEEYPPLDKMYRMYWYRSSLNKTMASCLKDIVDKTWSKFLNRNKVEPERVMDIGCFPENTDILMSDYSKKYIQNVEIGDYVLTPNNKECRILNKFNRKYNGKMFTIKTLNSFKLTATEEHPILNDKLEYVPINKLKVGDYIAVPRNKSKTNKQINKDKLLIYGWFLAEGSYIYSHKPLVCGINLCLSINEADYINELELAAKRLGYNTGKSIRKDRNTIELRIYSKEFAEEINKLFGRYSHGKFISREVFSWRDEDKIELIKNYFRGDGHCRINRKISQYTVISISKNLIYGIRDLLLQIGISCNIYYINKSYRLTISGPKIGILEPELISINKKDKSLYKTTENFIFVRIKEIITEQVNNLDVYNFEVENENAYIANSIAVHNCNDSTLLSLYPYWVFKAGYDPANNLRESASKVCDVFVNNYFDDSIEYKDKFDIITSIAMFYDLENPRKFIKGIKKYLEKDGIWVVQMTDLTTMIRKEVMAIDNLCFEHLQYYTLEVLSNLLKEFDMEVFDLEYNNVNGGSIRVYIGNVGKYKIEDRVSKALEEEKKILAEQTWDKLEVAFYEIVKSVRDFILSETKNGKMVYGLGASTKGNTFLQAVGLTSEHIRCIMEVSKEKYGKYTIGTNIPIVSEEAFEGKPDYVIILPWHFKDFFVEKNMNYLRNGGKFIVAMPEPKLISFDGVNIKEEKII